MGQVMNKDEIFKYLDELRDSGATNMYGSAKYIERRFGLDRNTAKDIVLEWMEQAH